MVNLVDGLIWLLSSMLLVVGAGLLIVVVVEVFKLSWSNLIEYVLFIFIWLFIFLFDCRYMLLEVVVFDVFGIGLFFIVIVSICILFFFVDFLILVRDWVVIFLL